MGLALAAVVLSGYWVCTVQAGGKERGRPIAFSEPKSDELSTNLNQLTSKRDSLKALEEDLSKSLQTLSGKSSLDGVPAPSARPPSGPVIPSKRVRDLLERRRNAIFLTLEDLAPAPTAEEILKVPEYGQDGMEKKKKKDPIELYYERQDTKRAADLKPTRPRETEPLRMPDNLSPRDVSPRRDDSDLPPALKEREQEIKKLFETETGPPTASPTPVWRSSFADVFGLGENTPSREQTLEHKKRMDDFRSILEFRRPASSSPDGPTVLNGSPDQAQRAANPFAAPDAFSGGDSPLGPINPIFSPTGPLDVNEQLLGPSSLAPLAPKTEPPKRPLTPTFVAPRRPF